MFRSGNRPCPWSETLGHEGTVTESTTLVGRHPHEKLTPVTRGRAGRTGTYITATGDGVPRV